jgi:hypothetical protein
MPISEKKRAAQLARANARAAMQPVSVKHVVLQAGLTRAQQAAKEGAKAEECLQVLKEYADIANACGDTEV